MSQARDALPLDHGGPLDRPFEPFPETAEARSVAHRFDEIAARYPDNLAIRDGDVSLNYAELAALVDRIAAAVAGAAKPPGVVGVLLNHGYRFVAAVLGVMAAGHACVPLEADHPAERNARIATHAGVGAVVSAGGLADQARHLFGGGPSVVDLDAVGHVSMPPPPRPGADDVAYILYTSGSTGVPKGVFQTHRGLIHSTREWVNTGRIGADDRMATFYSPASIAGLGKLLISVLTGGSLEVISPVQIGAAATARALKDREVTLINCSPTLLRHIVEGLDPGQRLDSVRLVTIGGERVDWGDVDVVRRGCRPDARMVVHLGATEVWVLHSQWFVDEAIRPNSPLMPVGRGMPGRTVTLVDDEGRHVPDGEIGEVVVSSRGLAQGYWREPDLTAAAFGSDPSDPSLRTYRTGDLARQRPDGLREFAGRKDEQIKLHGYRVEPGEVEGALRGCSGVRDAAVVVRRSVKGVAKALAAYVELQPGVDGLRSRHLMAMLAQRVPAHMMPAVIVIVDALPWLPNFKMDRQTLQKIDAEAGSAPAGPADPVVTEIIGLFERILAAEGAQADDNLLSLGGDSLNAAEIAVELKRLYGLEMDVADFDPTRSMTEWATLAGGARTARGAGVRV